MNSVFPKELAFDAMLCCFQFVLILKFAKLFIYGLVRLHQKTR